MRYIDYDFYKSQNRPLSEEQFDSVIIQAEDMIDNITANRAVNAHGYKRERVNKAVAAICDELYRQYTAPNEKEVSSASNSGRSESYVIISAAEKQAVIKSLVFNYLSGTGLTGAL